MRNNNGVKQLLPILLAGILVACGPPPNKLIGRWKRIKEFQDGIEVSVPFAAQNRTREMQFKSDGQLLYFDNGKPIGIGIYKYKTDADSIYITNMGIEPYGPDSATGSAHYYFTGDTLKLEKGNRSSLYIKD